MKPAMENNGEIIGKHVKMPGPSDYEPNYEFLLSRGLNNGVSFSKNPRFDETKEPKKSEKFDLTGPGKYNIEEKSTGPYYR